MNRIHELRNLHDWYNDHEFGFELKYITLLCKRNTTKDGWYSYRAHKNDTPMRAELCRAAIIVCDDTWDEGTMEATLVHEMIHQWQAEVLNEDPTHNDNFNNKAIELEEKYGLLIR
jgi:hypothetical protein